MCIMKPYLREMTEISDLKVKYYGKNKTVAKLIVFIGIIGRRLKNMLPYTLQKKIYHIYRG